nr:PREDICTED: uncharacterized protein LOC106705847 [Latimeria chalumnae]|eukprot:XP_014351365.1 PREDICTED: uncharacterized protein LOC106705847 [Latimeria chalumnae]
MWRRNKYSNNHSCKLCKIFASKMLIFAMMLFFVTHGSADELRFSAAAGSSVHLPGIEKGASQKITYVTWSLKTSKVETPDDILDYKPGAETALLYLTKFKGRYQFDKGNFSLWLEDLREGDSGNYLLNVYTDDGNVVKTRVLQVVPVDGTSQVAMEGSSLLIFGPKEEILFNISLIRWKFLHPDCKSEVTILEYQPPFKNYSFLSKDHKDRITFNERNFSLLLQNAKTVDSGYYILEQLKHGESHSSRTPVKVFEPELSSPQIYSEGSSLLLFVTKEKILSGVSQIRWTFLQPNSKSAVTILDYQPHSDTYSLLSEGYKGRIEFSKKNFSLLLRSVIPMDHGIYVLEQYSDDTGRFVKIPVVILKAENLYNWSSASVGGLSFFTFCLGFITALLLAVLAIFCRCCYSVRWIKELMKKLTKKMTENFADEVCCHLEINGK